MKNKLIIKTLYQSLVVVALANLVVPSTPENLVAVWIGVFFGLLSWKTL